ncbi:hypothetical protein F0U62_38300 [Cystobacter fuscus]|uniref:diaminopimelate decarboxylase family protein n=1 Tax=Cystobacter fuscus TaxID=43 RepID=UPI002B284478|nr:hypothetical protein F0U62_38300 [Cystobacter fuscus]
MKSSITAGQNRNEVLAPSARTPFYLYDESQIQDSLARFRSIPYANSALHFATMANDNPFLLRLLKKEGFGVFVNSPKHLKAAFDAGFSSEDIIFASTGLSRELMELLIKHKIHVNLDSLSQVALYGSLNPGSQVGIRINIDEKSKNNVFIGAESRIGMLESELPALFELASRHGLRLTGTHVYLGTDIALKDILQGIEKTLALSDRFPGLEFIDLGGGFPIDPERFDFEAYKKTVSALFEDYSRKRGRSIKMIIEPGRSLFGQSGTFFTTVTDVKERPNRIIVCCDASASLIPRAMFYEDYNPVTVPGGEGKALFDKPVDIVGSTTYSRDFLAKGISLPRVEVGEQLIFGQAGSYCYSMITRFLGQALPPEILRTVGGQFEIIRPGESFLTEAGR